MINSKKIKSTIIFFRHWVNMHQLFHNIIFNSDHEEFLKNHFQLHCLINKQKYKNPYLHTYLGEKIEADFV